MIKAPLFFRLLILFVSSPKLENRSFAEITCCVTLCMSPSASPTSWTLITFATARQSVAGDGNNCRWLWTYGQQEDRMNSYCSVICVDTLDDSKFIKPAQKKKKKVAGKQCSVCAGYRWLKNQLQWDWSVFFAVHRLYYLHRWKPLLYLLNLQIKHYVKRHFYLKASPALFPLTPRMTLMWRKSSCRHAAWIEDRLRDMVL